MNINWIEAAHQLNRQGEAYIMVTLIGVSGSTPRNSGTKMVITAEQIYDTIGGGHLEHKCVAHAHKMLAEQQQGQHLENFQLGAKLGQCCGGQTSVLFEYFAQSSVNITLFGAGHVGQSLIGILADLPCKVTWVDSREEQFPNPVFMRNLSNVTTVVSDHPEDMVAKAPDNSYFIVMTHNHQMDFEICQTILERRSFKYLGLIASKTKWRRFQQRFGHRDIDPALVRQMSCPIGSEHVPGKKPMEIAVSIAAEIIAQYQQVEQPEQSEQAEKSSSTHQAPAGVHWNELKQLLNET
ncbi:MAG: xanthine dehydrogenase accessory protein XdhC [Algicola sp.]|nr:xanthine dehydrogenase accessory protein XdhC [Algicola sp.]